MREKKLCPAPTTSRSSQRNSLPGAAPCAGWHAVSTATAWGRSDRIHSPMCGCSSACSTPKTQTAAPLSVRSTKSGPAAAVVAAGAAAAAVAAAAAGWGAAKTAADARRGARSGAHAACSPPRRAAWATAASAERAAWALRTRDLNAP